MSTPPPQTRMDAPLVRLAVVTVLGSLAPLLDTTIVTVVLAPLTRELAAPLTTTGWIVSGYLLAQAAVVPVTGWATDRLGARAVWTVSLAAFGVGSLLCGLAWSVGSLVAFRVLQGVGGGTVLAVGASALTRAAGPQRIGRVTAAVSVPAYLTPIAGPLLGGLLADTLGWRWCFLVNVPVCALAIACVRLLPDTGRRPGERLDVRGLLLVSPGLAAVVFGLSDTGSVAGAVALGAGAVLLAGFTAHALRTRHPPLVDVRLFADRAFAASSGLLFLVGSSVFGAMVLVPLQAQQVHGSSAFAAGLVLAPQFAGSLAALPVTGRLTDRFAPRWVVLAAVAVAVLATLPLTVPDPPPAVVGAALFVRGTGLALAATAITATAYRAVDPAVIPRATSALQIGQRVGAPFGSAVLVAVLAARTAGATTPAQVASGFAGTFVWSIVLTVPSLVLALALPGRRPTGDG